MTRGADPYALGHRGGRHDGGGHDGGTHGRGGDGSTGHGEGGPASKRIITGYGFWIFLLSDIVMFLGFSASYAVLAGATADGPGGDILFDLGRVKRETACLLLSRYACGLAGIAAARGNMAWTHIGLLVTGLLGAVFLFLEVQEFAQMIAEGAGPQRSAFLSAFFALVGCRGLHVGIGLLWLDDDGADLRKGLSRRRHAPGDVLQSLLARARHRLDSADHDRLFVGTGA
jgi:cytochrome o ubiquinol oxidase subunit 3